MVVRGDICKETEAMSIRLHQILQYDFILPLLPIFYHYSRSVQIPKFETTANVNVTNRDIRKKILQNHSNCGIYQSVDQQKYGNIYVS